MMPQAAAAFLIYLRSIISCAARWTLSCAKHISCQAWDQLLAMNRLAMGEVLGRRAADGAKAVDALGLLRPLLFQNTAESLPVGEQGDFHPPEDGAIEFGQFDELDLAVDAPHLQEPAQAALS